MSFLAPLYIAGLLAISLPILFHLIRRAPRERQEFSSLMFLSPSPPRLTRRSRLNNILLLLLRAAALALLAFAFARPFLFNESTLSVTQQQGRRIALLVDTSASMQRGDLWSQAVRQVDEVLSSLTPGDDVSLILFDRTARTAMSFNEWTELEPTRRSAVLQGRIKEARPTWNATRLGDALAAACDHLSESASSQKDSEKPARQIILISDLQQGSRIETLQGYRWPEDISVDVKPVAAKQHTSNATLQLASDSTETAEGADRRLRVRIINQPDSRSEQLTLTWANTNGPIPGIEPIKSYVAPGRAQIVRVNWPAPETRADRLILQGDDADFDNTLYLVPPRIDQIRVVYLGAEAPTDTDGLLFYLQSALDPTPTRKLELVVRRADQPLAAEELNGSRLLVIAETQSESRISAIRQFIESGGSALWVLKDASSVQPLAQLLQTTTLGLSEATPRGFALLSRVDLDHPLFQTFADARFADFSKIHFWHYRKLSLPDSPTTRTLAALDDGSPLLMEQSIGKGQLLILTSGWTPKDSQLALSTKFVPLIDAMLRRGQGPQVAAQVALGDPIALPQAEASSPRRVITPKGQSIDLDTAAQSYDAADAPGIYRLINGTTEIPVAVNLATDESRTTPLNPDELAAFGAKLGTTTPPEQLAERQRHLQATELEGRQKLWRYLILAVLGFLFAETALAGHLARRSDAAQVNP